MTDRRDRLLGCLTGLAAGDALGYEVEFRRWEDIRRRFGPAGITEYALRGGKAEVSDDTQMALFTAEALALAVETGTPPEEALWTGYRCWLKTQGWKVDAAPLPGAWLPDYPVLCQAQAPGNTCLSALNSGKLGSVAEPINNSKGCGGVMRTAPVGFLPLPGSALALGAETAAITHGHPGGWAPGGMLADIVRRCIYGPPKPLADIFTDSLAAVRAAWDLPEVRAFADMVDRAMDLSAGPMADVDAIHALGGGWVGDEALAIAIFCCLRHLDSIPEALIAAVNHSGDSDSTGAICGNILGAHLGLARIPEDWTAPLELRDLILRLARKMTDEAAGMMSEKQ